MKEYIRARAQDLGEFVIKTRATVRLAARHFGISKSTVHKDVTERLLEIDTTLALRVAEILEINLRERHLRGGEATRKKYIKSTECRVDDE